MQKLVIASGNLGKIKEFETLLTNYTLLPQSTFDTPETPELGLSFIENAILKARNAAKHSNLPAIADDSGLAVDALGGAPGIYSARYASDDTNSGANDENNIDKLLENMEGRDNRSAQFYCVIAFVKTFDDPTPIIAEGIWHGEITHKRSGENGFGYDSVFFIPEQNKTSAELSATEKNTLSHRAKALQILTKKLEKM